jgi:NADPH2:quinone reductase
MRAATFTHTGPAVDVLHVGDVPTPEPRAGEVRVRIAASGINPSDVKRRGAKPDGSPAEFPVVIPHSDGAGTIDVVGAGVPPQRVGERVWLYNAQWQRPFGTAAEYCVVPSAFAVPLPDCSTFAEGANLGIPALTAYHAIMLDGPVNGKTLLVQGGAGAVGFYAIQFAKFSGAMVIATVSSPEKAAIAKEAGADFTIDYRAENPKQRVAEITGGGRVDRIIEVDLAANAVTYPDLLVEHGKAVVYGSGAPQITIPGAFIRQSTTLQFFIVYQLREAERAGAVAAIDSMLNAGQLKHLIGERFPLDRIVEAHETVERGSVGNVVLEFPSM